MILTDTPVQKIKRNSEYVTLEPSITAFPTISSSTKNPIIPPTVTFTVKNEVIVQQCLQKVSGMPNNIVSSGILVTRQQGVELMIFDFINQWKREITDNILSAGVSPNGKWLTYETINNNQQQLVTESADGEKKYKVIRERYWNITNHIFWLDNLRIWFPETSTTQPSPSVLVLDPFTGKKELLKTNYPGIMDFYNFGTGPIRLPFGYSSAIYDSSLNYVIYPEYDQTNGYYQTLWNRKSQEVIVKVPGNGYFQNLPIMMEGQNWFLLVGYPSLEKPNNEWLKVSLDGRIELLTTFGEAGIKYLIKNDAALSPDGKILAFDLSIWKPDQSAIESTHLILLNLETHQVIDTCLSADWITWSLDGQYIAISTPADKKTINNILLIDISKKRVYQLMSGKMLLPVGWMTQP